MLPAPFLLVEIPRDWPDPIPVRVLSEIIFIADLHLKHSETRIVAYRSDGDDNPEMGCRLHETRTREIDVGLLAASVHRELSVIVTLRNKARTAKRDENNAARVITCKCENVRCNTCEGGSASRAATWGCNGALESRRKLRQRCAINYNARAIRAENKNERRGKRTIGRNRYGNDVASLTLQLPIVYAVHSGDRRKLAEERGRVTVKGHKVGRVK
jgi:hypothetical protein